MVNPNSKRPAPGNLLASPPQRNASIAKIGLHNPKAEKKTSSGNVMITTEVKKWLDSLSAPLSPSELENWIISKNRSAASLLTPGRILMPKMGNYLEEALQRYPNDPEVLQAAILSGYNPSAKDQMLETLKRVAPDHYTTVMLDALRSAQAEDAPGVLDILRRANGNAAQDIDFSGYKSMIRDLYIYSGRDEVASAAWGEFGMNNLALISHITQLKNQASEFVDNPAIQAGVVSLLQDLGAARDAPLEVITYALMNERTLSKELGKNQQQASFNLGIPHFEYQGELDFETGRNQILMDFYVNISRKLPSSDRGQLELFFAEVQNQGVSGAIFKFSKK